MKRFYLTETASGSVKLESIVSFSLTWNGCFHYHICNSSLPRYMDCDLIQAQLGVTIGRISNNATFPVGHSREILALFPSLTKQEFLMGETPKQAATFISRFMEVKVNFLSLTSKRPDGCIQRQALGEQKWFLSSSENWRSHCSSVGFILQLGCVLWNCFEPL